MSIASSEVTPRLGITEFPCTPCGSRTQRMRFTGWFGRASAMNSRFPIPEREGPTIPCAPVMPGIVWHEPHPYREMLDAPRSGSPPVIAAACFFAATLQLARTPARSAMAPYLVGIAPPIRHQVALPKPEGEHPEPGAHVNQSRRNPHDQAADPLVVQ